MLPSVDEVLGNEKIKNIIENYPRALVLDSIREIIDEKRQLIISLDEKNEIIDINLKSIIKESTERVVLNYSLSLEKVINGTGVILHTNLGRSLLSESIKEDVWQIASRYSNLEYNIDSGKRGSRYTHLVQMIKKLTKSEDVLVVNNNAAAVLLVLNTLAKDGEAIVSRGELVEVGGAFRIPSIMSLSGAELVEVGSTNKTHIDDYEDAINENTKVLMKVHTSNYKILGFTESVEIKELSKISKKYNIPLIEDLGSGVFIDLSKYGLSYEPTILDSINQGADIVTFSGDKMLGGPQAGIIVGKKVYIEKMKKNQLTRALRVDKMTIGALEATLRLYLDEDKAIKEIPTLRMLTYTLDELSEKSKKLYEILLDLNLDIDINIENGFSQVGGGSMPTENLDTYLISIIPKNMSVSSLERKLRLSDSHIIGRIYENKYLLDIRTIFDDEFEDIAKELSMVFR
ncbi:MULTISPECIES: L-seryl-tRNA(Sec) selenium transferase [unclassified Romboutsia]|uniref:L-seryl-tRNA(Sec) selenium transferase n=1 Tax=unclassified Romboutsia TaxID=2626894 RepID=UPI001FAA06DE|nr:MULTISPECIES: L-seryl-tRNA(Sec) selenium transferase [unclassified Romboutsia]